jgi:uncharacterized surface protein with fasciclin (FAS1) repeats
MKKYIIRSFAKATVFILIFTCLSNCEIQENFDYVPSNSTKYLNVSAMEYIASNDSLSLLKQAIDITGLNTYYNGLESKTFIAPRNDAFRTYLADNGFNTLSDIPVPVLRNILLYHIVDAVVSFDDPELLESDKPIAYASENGQPMYLSHKSNFIGIINDGTNFSIEIKTSNLAPTNGVIHIVYNLAYYQATTASTEVPEAEYDTIFALQDTYINAGANTDVNYGSDPLIRVKNVDGSSNWDRRGYLMFDTRDFTKNGVVTEVTLEMGVESAKGKGLPVYVYPVEDTLWDEMSMTWNNAPSAGTTAISSTTSAVVSSYKFEITDYITGFSVPAKITLMLAAEPNGDDTNDLASKENTEFAPPMIIARLAAGISTLNLKTNAGLSCGSGSSVILSVDKLKADGPVASDIIYTLTQTPENGWLMTGGKIMTSGDKFTQLDINYGNIVYVNAGGPKNNDTFFVTLNDKDGGSISPFEVNVSIL